MKPKRWGEILRARAKRLSAQPDQAFPCTCGGAFVAVTDSRPREGYLWRRRFCGKCGARVTTYERVAADDAATRQARAWFDVLVVKIRAAMKEEGT